MLVHAFMENSSHTSKYNYFNLKLKYKYTRDNNYKKLML